MIEKWQWMHGNYESDLFDHEDQAVRWAERATTGADDDGIAVRRLAADPWRRLNSQGWVDPEPEPKPNLADVLLEWADQMEAESPGLGGLLAAEVRTRINNFFKEGK